MRKSDWLFAAMLLGMGFMCLTVSATSLLEHPLESYVQTLLTLCAWVGAPLALIGGIYLIIYRKKKKAETDKETGNSKYKD